MVSYINLNLSGFSITKLAHLSVRASFFMLIIFAVNSMAVHGQVIVTIDDVVYLEDQTSEELTKVGPSLSLAPMEYGDADNCQLFPNPVDNALTILKSESTTIQEVRVLDEQFGSICEISNPTSSFVITDMKTGSYYFEVETSAGLCGQWITKL